jgi:hypothetical protein
MKNENKPSIKSINEVMSDAGIVLPETEQNIVKCTYCRRTDICKGAYPEGCFLEHDLMKKSENVSEEELLNYYNHFAANDLNYYRHDTQKYFLEGAKAFKLLSSKKITETKKN